MSRKLNNKGITLIELIVSFVLVAIAIIYFYQTLYTVKKLYSESQKDTKNFVDVNYAYRIINELNKNCNSENCSNLCERINNYKRQDSNFLVSNCEEPKDANNVFKVMNFKINQKDYSMYFYEDGFNNQKDTLETNLLNLISGSNINGPELESTIMSSPEIDTGLLEEFEIDDDTTKPVWCLNTQEDAKRTLQCASGNLPYEWCNSLKFTAITASRISQVASGTRNDKYCIFKLNNTYKLISTDQTLTW